MENKKIRNLDIKPRRTNKTINRVDSQDLFLAKKIEIKNEPIVSREVESVKREVPDKFALDLDKEERKEKKTGNINWVKVFISLVSVFFIIFIVSNYLLNAKIYIKSKNADFKTSGSVTAYPGNYKNISNSELSFDTITITKSVEEDFEGEVRERDGVKASGKVTFYNNYSTVPFKVYALTRVVDKEGKVFRVPSTVSVPGYKMVKGKKVAGKREAVVYADEFGEKYNIKLKDLVGDFTIPRYIEKDGDEEKFKNVYARQKTDFTQGKDGVVELFDENGEAKNLEDYLKNKVIDVLSLEINRYQNEDYIVAVDMVDIDFDKIKIEKLEKEGRVKASINGTLLAPAFNKNLLSRVLLSSIGININMDRIKVNSIKLDEIKIQKFSNFKDNPFVFNLDSNISIKYLIQKDVIKDKLAGNYITEIDKLLSTIPYIEESRGEVFPFWKSRFPKDVEKIEIIEE